MVDLKLIPVNYCVFCGNSMCWYCVEIEPITSFINIIINNSRQVTFIAIPNARPAYLLVNLLVLLHPKNQLLLKITHIHLSFCLQVTQIDLSYLQQQQNPFILFTKNQNLFILFTKNLNWFHHIYKKQTNPFILFTKNPNPFIFLITKNPFTLLVTTKPYLSAN